jgi:NTP pyrophosphatase (non-canonical NTP hydrolase)
MNSNSEELGSITRLNEYQQFAARTAADLIPHDEHTIITMALGLTGEAGEAADLVKKWYAHGHPLDSEKLKKELGDILWYVAGQATANGWTLADVATTNIEKLTARYPEGFSTERSLERLDSGVA